MCKNFPSRPVPPVPSRLVPSQGISGREIFVPKSFGTGQIGMGQNSSSGRDGTRDEVVPILSRPEYINMCFYIISLKKSMCTCKYTWHFFMKNMVIIEFEFIMLYKMYYKSNTELIYLSVTNTKYHTTSVPKYKT